MAGPRVRVVAVFGPSQNYGRYYAPRGYIESMLKEAAPLVATQERAAGQAYRAQVWAFLGRLVARATVEEC